MEFELNHLSQPVGLIVHDWKPPHHPGREPMLGRFCRLEPLDPMRHAQSLYASNAVDVEGKNWTYLPYGPFESLESYRAWIEQYCAGNDPLFFAIIDLASDRAAGVSSYLRINPGSGSIEVGHINLSPQFQRTPSATEAMYLMMARAFGLGYRRYEWKCDALNAPSRAAARRLGLSFEGVCRQTTIVKGRNRDTAWYAAIDPEWPAIQNAFLQWLSPSNFDERGKQRSKLSDLTAPILQQRG
jgi:RimJ/RimL family protein N-acetyltransferase